MCTLETMQGIQADIILGGGNLIPKHIEDVSMCAEASNEGDNVPPHLLLLIQFVI